MTVRPGDRITFRAICRWNNGETVTRIVKTLDERNRPLVRYGWPNFIVRAEEIIAVNGERIEQ